MVRDINDLVDERTMDIQSVGEDYHDRFLMKRPTGEWAPYLDETAKDLRAGVQLGDLALSKDDFGPELGEYYRRGLETNAGRYADLPAVLERRVSDRKLGLLAYQLNELSYDITTTDVDIDDVQHATEAVIEKLLTRHAGSDLEFAFDLAGGTVADITTQLFKNETVAANVDTLLSEFERNASTGLLALLDEPQMMTPLWDHQREALANWVDADHRGYVDMATATGKTVLGLGAIALQFGEPHPDDQELTSPRAVQRGTGSNDVLIVAHSDLILEQWRREFDRHLNIPQERTTGSDDINLEWGTVHFRTPQALVNEERVDYDLVLLDEAHHYATGSEWGSLLDAFDGDVLAMSGSVDDAGADSDRIKDRLANSIGPEVKRYSITEAKADGVIPSFDWEVHYAPYDADEAELAKTARRAKEGFSEFRERLESGELTVETDRRLRTYEDVRRFSHTTEGSALKQEDEAFRDLVTRLFSRRAKRWNLSPLLDSVLELVVEHSTTENVVVLADSNAQVEELDSRLQGVLPDTTAIHRVSNAQSRTEQREAIDEFDEPESSGVLLGTGDLLGEGVDMQHADVAVNMATGGVNPELVQRIGRVLRNPASTPKHAMFYNVVGVPPSVEASVSREDGMRLIEQAAGFCALGGRFDKLPGFAAAEAVDDETLESLLRAGTAFVDELDGEGVYDWDQDTVEELDLRALLSAVREHHGAPEATLGSWEEYAWEHSMADADQPTADPGEQSNESTEAQSRTQDPTTEELAERDRERIADIVRRQPVEARDLRGAWGLTSTRETLQYLQTELGPYHFRDGDDLVWASDAAEALVDETETAVDDETVGDTREGDETAGLTREGAETGPDATPSKAELIDAIQRVEGSLDEVPTKRTMTEHGAYTVEAFEAAFGTWSDAVQAAGFEPHGKQTKQYSREEVISGIQAVAEAVEEPPSVADINDHAEFSASVVYNFFDSLGAARSAAGVDEIDSGSDQPTDRTDEEKRDETEDDGAIEPNPLAEQYELFRQFESLLGRIVDADGTAYRWGGDQSMNAWRTVIDGLLSGAGAEDAPCYGEQQSRRSDVSMTEYREAFGDGDRVTEYRTLPTATLDGDDVAPLQERGILEPGERIEIPVAPESGVRLPVVVTTREEFEEATALLAEFPSEPEPELPSSRSREPEAVTDEPNDGRPVREPESHGDDRGPAGEPNRTEPAAEEAFWDQTADPITEYADGTEPEEDAGTNGDDLDRKIDEWKSQLLDLTRRNKLIAFKPTKSKSLPLVGADPTIVASHLDGGDSLYIRRRPAREEGDTPVAVDELGPVDADELVPTRVTGEAEQSLAQIGRNNKQYLREQGVDTLYLSLGMLRWFSVDHSDEANRSPLFLAPVELEEATQRDADHHDYVLKPKAEGLRLNPALRKKLAAERDLALPADSALSLERIDAAFQSVHKAVQGFERWSIQPDVVLGIFDFTKFSLYSDLERNRDAIKSDPVIRALNGDTEPIREAEGAIRTPSAGELDDVVDPVDTYQVLEADSSQQEAIEAAKRGKSFVLQGPPGTGKSQTIANIIAEKLAVGERVLFVSEKQAALDVVKDRLDDVGIGRFCLEIHGEKANNADVLSSLEDELKAGQVKPAESRTARLERLRDRRDTLNDYGDLLFFTPEGWDRTVYQAFGIVSDHADVHRIAIGIDDPIGLGETTVDRAVEELETLARYEDELESYESSPWRHTTLTQWGVDTGGSMRQSLDQQLVVLEELGRTADGLAETYGVRADSLSALRDAEELLAHLRERPALEWQAAFFDGSFTGENSRLEELAELEQERRALIDELSTDYQRSFFSADGAGLNDELAGHGLLKALKPSYRSLKRRITTHARERYDPDHEQLLEDTRKLAEIQRIEARREDYQDVVQRLGPLYAGDQSDWDTLVAAKSWTAELDRFDDSLTDPIVDALLSGEIADPEPIETELADRLERYADATSFFEEAMAVEELSVAGETFEEASLAALSETLERLRAGVPSLQRRVQFEAQLETVRESVCGPYVERFLDGDYTANQLVPAFEKRFYTEWLNAVYEATPLGSFNANAMERYVEEFRKLDEEQQELAKVQIQHEVTKRRPSLNLEHAASSEQVLVRRETEKQRRHKPLRELFEEAGSFITEHTPCFMMSPLSVAQYLEAGSIEFDAVVFDEASQIMPQDAVSSLIRADQAIIAGDTKQLPPTSFFQSDVETTEDVRDDLDSILEETASVLPEKDLRWHYRSRTSELIEFSNYHYYNDSLRTFPDNDPDVETGVEFEYVSDGVYDRGGSRQNEVEAERVVDLIEEHAEEHGEKSLGVVAFSSAQEQAIRDAIEKRREENAVLDAFVGQDDVLDEFFVKNLEMVQGDERDRMLFSVGYGPDRDGTVSMNFGPLNKSGGERRLNVAVTRAKETVTVVSSLQPGDIDLTRTSSTGVAQFKNYLEYAKNGERALTRDDSVTRTLDFDSRFEEAVYDALVAEGYDVVSQVESSSYSIDLAIKHPDQPGTFVLGIECDGAAYHSSRTARDRDHTRQLVLESLGWTIHRIWSPDWASNQQREVQKITQRVDSLVGGAAQASGKLEVPTYEPEVVETGSKTDHEAITEFEEPALEWDERYSASAMGMETANRNSIQDTVLENGPIEYDTAMRTYLDVWSQSRAGKKVQRIFRAHVDSLTSENELYEHDGFLWPPYDDLEFRIRVNTSSVSRSIDLVPVEEVARAIALVLAEGGTITEDDLVLEVTRLFGYQRRGNRIEERIGEALSLLEATDVVERGERISSNQSVDVGQSVLSRVYPSLPESDTGDGDDDKSHTETKQSVRSETDGERSVASNGAVAGKPNTQQANAETPSTTDSDVLETARGQELLGLFETYVDREEHGDDWIDLTFENDGETDIHYQYAGVHNLLGLTSEQRRTVGSILNQRDGLTIEDESDVALLFTSETVEPEGECRLCVELLERVYDTSLAELEAAAEHGKDSVLPDEAESEDTSFPFLGSDRAQWNAHCPYCGSGVHNTETAFVTHWVESEPCPGPTGESPPPGASIDGREWAEVVEHCQSTGPTESEGRASTNEGRGQSVEGAIAAASELPVGSPDGTFPWLEFPDEGWNVSCPYCSTQVYNGREAFVNHWREAGDCPGPPGRDW